MAVAIYETMRFWGGLGLGDIFALILLHRWTAEGEEVGNRCQGVAHGWSISSLLIVQPVA
jgi:hypothetical protein